MLRNEFEFRAKVSGDNALKSVTIFSYVPSLLTCDQSCIHSPQFLQILTNSSNVLSSRPDDFRQTIVAPGFVIFFFSSINKTSELMQVVGNKMQARKRDQQDVCSLDRFSKGGDSGRAVKRPKCDAHRDSLLKDRNEFMMSRSNTLIGIRRPFFSMRYVRSRHSAGPRKIHPVVVVVIVVLYLAPPFENTPFPGSAGSPLKQQ